MLWQYVNSGKSKTNADIYEEVLRIPSFPDIGIITQISSEEYERKQCHSNMIFIPQEMSTPKLPLEYDSVKYYLEINDTRAIRKLLESVDADHALVFFWDNNEKKYYTAGVDLIDKYVKCHSPLPVYVVRIMSAMVWVISVCNVLLLGYKKGEYVSGNQILKDKNEKIEKIIRDINDWATKAALYLSGANVWENICNDILEARHGTSFVLFGNTAEAENEARRLSKFQRAILTKDPQDYSNDKVCKEFLKQNSAIDGGLVFDISGKCFAYGCIFDGTLPSVPGAQFKGNSGRGARYNSMSLYIYMNNYASKVCMGVVFSDDYSVDTIIY